jgi:hypothetical protein
MGICCGKCTPVPLYPFDEKEPSFPVVIRTMSTIIEEDVLVINSKEQGS